MRQNIALQIGGQLQAQLAFASNTNIVAGVTIPLYLKTADVPVRKPKMSEIDTIPTHDEVGWSDWSTHAIFMGGMEPLQTTLEGFMVTPVSTKTDQYNQKYQIVDPTGDGALLGYTYGDVIWGYISGKLNTKSPSILLRQDPATYTDSYGNVYGSVVVAQFESQYTVWARMETFSMTLYLEE